MNANEKQPDSDENLSRKQRRAAERATRKSGTSTSAKVDSGRSSGPSMLVISLGAIAIGVIAVIALVLVSGGLGGDSSEISEPGAPAPATELRDGRTLVAAGATPAVTVEIFEDVQCPTCIAFTQRTEPLLIAKHVTDGTASLTYNDYIVFGDDSTDAAMAMRAADELGEAFWDYHHVLYHNATGGAFTKEWLADIAEVVGLDREEFLELLDDEALRDAVAADHAYGSNLGVTGTPTLFINGEQLVAPSWEELDAAVQAAATP